MLKENEKMPYLKVGTIVNTQGLQGEVRVLSVSDFTEERFQKKKQLALFDKQDHFVQMLEIVSHRKQKTLDIVKFKDLYHINAVEGFKGFTLKIAQTELQDLAEGEFYYHEIIGLPVYEGEHFLGHIKEILQPGANDVWVVERPQKRDLLLPYIPSVILQVDLKKGHVLVDVMEGLDDEN